jgi:hypothetical protein
MNAIQDTEIELSAAKRVSFKTESGFSGWLPRAAGELPYQQVEDLLLTPPSTSVVFDRSEMLKFLQLGVQLGNKLTAIRLDISSEGMFGSTVASEYGMIEKYPFTSCTVRGEPALVKLSSLLFQTMLQTHQEDIGILEVVENVAAVLVSNESKSISGIVVQLGTQ